MNLPLSYDDDYYCKKVRRQTDVRRYFYHLKCDGKPGSSKANDEASL